MPSLKTKLPIRMACLLAILSCLLGVPVAAQNVGERELESRQAAHGPQVEMVERGGAEPHTHVPRTADDWGGHIGDRDLR